MGSLNRQKTSFYSSVKITTFASFENQGINPPISE